MSVKINPPVFNKEKGFERYLQELSAWSEITSLDKKKMGIAVALSLPESDETGIRGRVFEEIDLNKLETDDGLGTLITFMKKHLGKDDLADSLEKYEDFEDFRRNGLSMTEYISKFDLKYNRILRKDMKLPSEILAFMLLRKAEITREERLLVLTGLDYEKRDTLYEQAEVSLRKFKGDAAESVVGSMMPSNLNLPS